MSADSKTQLVQSVLVDFPGHDRLEANRQEGVWTIHVVGCVRLEDEIQQRFAKEKSIENWTLPQGSHHSDLLIRELILRVRGEWEYPYKDDELCHCRSVPTEIVDQAILAGAHTCPEVSARTSASTACGTCRPDVQKILNFRLGRKD